MLEDLKKEAAASGTGMQFSRLTLFVAACVIIAALVVLAQTCSEAIDTAEESQTEQVESVTTAPERVPADVLLPLITRDVVEPDGGTRAVEEVGQYAEAAIFHMRTAVQGEPPSFFATRLTPDELRVQPLDDAIGRIFEVEGEVMEVVEQRWQTDTGRLWSIVLQAEDGAQVVAIKHGLASDVAGGRPRDAYEQAGARRPIRVGETVMVRGYYLQRRTGTLGRTSLSEPTPVLWGVAWRERFPASERVAPLPSLAEVDWIEVRDRTYAETQFWNQDQLYQVIQWARALGHDEIKRRIESGEIESQLWDQETFATWQKEVIVKDEGDPRPFTDGARGKWFHTTGLIGNWAYEGWNTVKRNVWGVDNVFEIDIVSDYYGNWAIRNISAFPMQTYGDITGERAEHVRIYGVFYKNYSYETKRRDDSGKLRPLTMPMFIVLHVERVDYEGGASGYQQAMTIIAALIALLGFTFYFLFVRGESKDAKALERKRIARRRAQRVKREQGADGDDDS